MCKEWVNKTFTLAVRTHISELRFALCRPSLCYGECYGVQCGPILRDRFSLTWDFQSRLGPSLLASPSAVPWLEMYCSQLTFGLSGFILVFLIHTNFVPFVLVDNISRWHCTQNGDRASDLKIFWEVTQVQVAEFQSQGTCEMGGIGIAATAVHNRTHACLQVDKSCFLN